MRLRWLKEGEDSKENNKIGDKRTLSENFVNNLGDICTKLNCQFLSIV